MLMLVTMTKMVMVVGMTTSNTFVIMLRFPQNDDYADDDDNSDDIEVVLTRPAAVDDDNNDDNIDDNIDDDKVVPTRPAATPMRKTGRRERGCAVATHTWGWQK